MRVYRKWYYSANLNVLNVLRLAKPAGFTINLHCWFFVITAVLQRGQAFMQTGKYLIVAGIVLVAAGIIVYFFHDKLRWFGRLPGDIRIEKEHFSFYFPVTTMIIASVVLSLIVQLIKKLL